QLRTTCVCWRLPTNWTASSSRWPIGQPARSRTTHWSRPMAKPKGATLTQLFAVSDAERAEFWAKLRGKDAPSTSEVPNQEKGIPVSGTPDIFTQGTEAPIIKGVPEAGVPFSGTPFLGIPVIRLKSGSSAPKARSDLKGAREQGIPETGIPEKGTRA